jgi:hypothetical protein
MTHHEAIQELTTLITDAHNAAFIKPIRRRDAQEILKLIEQKHNRDK